MQLVKSLLYSGSIYGHKKQENEYHPIVFAEPVVIDEVKLIANGRPCHQKLRDLSVTTKDDINSIKFYTNHVKVKESPATFKLYINYKGGKIISDIIINAIDTFPCDIMLIEGDFDALTLNIYGVLYSSLSNNEDNGDYGYYRSVDDLANIDMNNPEIDLDENNPIYSNDSNMKNLLQPSLAIDNIEMESIYNNLEQYNTCRFNYTIKDEDNVYDLFDPYDNTLPITVNSSYVSDNSDGTTLVNSDNLLDSWLRNVNSLNIYQIYFVPATYYCKNILTCWRNEQFFQICDKVKVDEDSYKQLCDQYRYTWKQILEWISTTKDVLSNITKLKIFVIEFKSLLVYKYVKQKQPLKNFVKSAMDRVLLWLPTNSKNTLFSKNTIILIEYSINVLQQIWFLVQDKVSDLLLNYLGRILDSLAQIFVNEFICDSIKYNILKLLIYACFNGDHIQKILNHKLEINQIECNMYKVITDECLKHTDNDYSSYTWKPFAYYFLYLINYYSRFYRLEQFIKQSLNNSFIFSEKSYELECILCSILDLFDDLSQSDYSIANKVGLQNTVNLYKHHIIKNINIESTALPMDNDTIQKIIFIYAASSHLFECLIVLMSSSIIDKPNFTFLVKCILFQMISFEDGKILLLSNPTVLNHFASLLFNVDLKIHVNENFPTFTIIKHNVEKLKAVTWAQFAYIFLYEMQAFQLRDRLMKCFVNEKNFLIDDIEKAELISTCHSFIRLLLNDPIGYDTILRTVSSPKVFRCLCVSLYTTLSKSAECGISSKPLTAAYAAFMLIKFLNNYEELYLCIKSNIDIIIELIKIDQNNTFKPITEWFLPLLYISNKDEFITDMCIFVKDLLEGYVLNTERAKRLYIALVLLSGQICDLTHHDSNSLMTTTTNRQLQLAIKLCNIEAENVVILFEQQFSIIISNKSYIRWESLGQIVLKSLKYIIILLDAIFPIISQTSRCDLYKIANFDRKLVKSLISLNVYTLLIINNKYICEVQLDIREVFSHFQRILDSYLTHHSVSNNYIKNDTDHMHLLSCHHYSFKYLFKCMKSKIETFPSCLVIIYHLIEKNDYTNCILKSVLVNYWNDFMWMFEVCCSTSNPFLTCYITRMIAKISYFNPYMTIKFLVDSLMVCWDCNQPRHKILAVNYLQLLTILTQCEANAIAFIKYLSSIYHFIGNDDIQHKKSLLHVISNIVGDESNLNDDSIPEILLCSRLNLFIETLTNCLTNELIIENSCINHENLSIVEVIIERLFKSLDCYSSFLPNLQNLWFSLNKLLLNFFSCLICTTTRIKSLVLKLYLKNITSLQSIINTCFQINDETMQKIVAKFIHSILMNKDELSFFYNLVPNNIIDTKFEELEPHHYKTLLDIILKFAPHHFDNYIKEENLEIIAPDSTYEFDNICDQIIKKSKPFKNLLFPNSIIELENDFLVLNNNMKNEPLKFDELLKISDDLKLDTKNKINLLTSSLIILPSRSSLKVANPVVNDNKLSLSILNTNLLSINKAISSAKTQFLMEAWKKNKCVTSRLPSLHVDEFTSIVNKGVVNESSIKRSS